MVSIVAIVFRESFPRGVHRAKVVDGYVQCLTLGNNELVLRRENADMRLTWREMFADYCGIETI